MSSTPQTKSTDRMVDEADDTNMNSILVAVDDLCRIHCFLDGTYPLGLIHLNKTKSRVLLSSLYKDTHTPTFFAHPRIPFKTHTLTDYLPTSIRLSLLEHRNVRDLAKLSTTARELIWYIMRVVKEMRTVWFGSDSLQGAREVGSKWIRALEAKQKEQFGRRWLHIFLQGISLMCCLIH